MIYLFQGCQGICSLPGKACTGCGELCKQMNCKPIHDCCQSAGRACSQFTEKPLSSFVVITVVLSCVELYFLFGAVEAHGTATCHFPASASVGLPVWLYLQIGFSILNVLFAPFFQYQVWKRIMKDLQGDGATHGAVLTGPEHSVDKKVVQEAFKTVFLNDLVVLFYFFAMLASFVWSWMGGTWILGGTPDCNEGGLANWGAWLGLCLFSVVAFYSFCWYCCTCCASSVRLSHPIADYK